MLPDDRVVLLTNCGIMLVHAPGFAQLDGAAEIGGWWWWCPFSFGTPGGVCVQGATCAGSHLCRQPLDGGQHTQAGTCMVQPPLALAVYCNCMASSCCAHDCALTALCMMYMMR